MTESNRCLVASFEFLSKVASVLVLVLALLGLSPAGWFHLLDRARGHLGFRPLTAAAFLLAAVAALLWNPARTRTHVYLAMMLAAAVTGVGIWSAAAFLGSPDLARMQAYSTPQANAAFHVRMALASALGLVLLGLALLTVERRLSRYTSPSQLLALGVGLVALFGVFDYALNPLTSHLNMSRGATLCLGLMAVSLLNLRPGCGLMSVVTSDSPGGSMARRLLPAAVALSLLIGWLRWRGEQAGLYDTEVGVALGTSTQLVLLLLLIWSNARSLEKADRRQRAAESVLQQELERFRAREDAAKAGPPPLPGP